MKKDDTRIGKCRKIFTLTFTEGWVPDEMFIQKYRLISDIKETEYGYECNVELIDNKKL